ncbi:hypothetical protein PAXRUDRAFT_168729 [Paxillus rubicundulus Ve08.2h10]|uniref:Uncharacterized protein n=1 Tax=Paxillus rubicundulus Ve08.2h10 TaxID=930991 RepID=A0A0D0CNF1_9AGAM|nr:hypothetical protein PAXRUDRAFT_168729 [Paxillus rubicundulus Ve08.2h10]
MDTAEHVPLSDLWNMISNSQYHNIETRDLFQELQDTLASGKHLFSTPTSPLLSGCDDLALDDDSK